MSLKLLLKVSTDLAILISTGKSFQSLSADATKAQSLRVVKVLKLGWEIAWNFEIANMWIDVGVGLTWQVSKNMTSITSHGSPLSVLGNSMDRGAWWPLSLQHF